MRFLPDEVLYSDIVGIVMKLLIKMYGREQLLHFGEVLKIGLGLDVT